MFINDMGMKVDELTCLNIAKGLSPIDTGNLRFNAINSYEQPNGFVINYSLAAAYYIRLLEEGISSMKHVGFIANKTVPAIASYLYAKYASKDKNRMAMFNSIADEAKSYLADEDVKSSFNQETRSQRYESSLFADIDRDYGSLEPMNYEQYNPNFATENYEFRRRTR